MNECVICGKGCESECCSGACRAKKSRRMRKQKGLTNSKVANIGYLYLIQCIGFPYYKIGITRGSPQLRMERLQTGQPFELKLVKSVRVRRVFEAEQYFHNKYVDCSMRGEWYNLNANVIEQVKNEFEHVGLFYRITA